MITPLPVPSSMDSAPSSRALPNLNRPDIAPTTRPKFRFTVEGRIASINEYKNNVVRIAVTAARTIKGQHKSLEVIDWAPCISFDSGLNKRLMTELSIGQKVVLEGQIVPRRLDNGPSKKIHMLTLEIVRFAAIPRPTRQRTAPRQPWLQSHQPLTRQT